MSIQHAGQGTSGEGASGTALADVIDTILDKGLVIDAFVRASIVGIEVLTVDARIVVASADTYLRFAEATERLNLAETEKGLPEVVQGMKQADAVGPANGRALEAADEEAPVRDADERPSLETGGESHRVAEPRRARRRREG